MTPQDISNKRFDKGMSGYKTEDVHLFLDQVAEHVSELEQDKADLMEKLEVLAEKVEEYREDEDSLRAALIGAQKLGDSVVRESKRKAEAIIAGAVKKAEEIATDAQRKIDEEAYELEKMKREVASFKKQLIEMYSEHLKMLECLPDDDLGVNVPKLSYTPPVTDSVKFDVVREGEDGVITEEFEVGAVRAGLAEAREEEYAEEEAASRRGRGRYEKLSQFFGEDHPVERE